MEIYLFRASKLLHDGGHSLTALVASLLLLYVVGLPAWLSFLFGCVLLALILETIDICFGGLLVTREQREKILARRRLHRGYWPSPDTIKDIANYQIPWVFFFVFSFSKWPVFLLIGVFIVIVLFIIHFLFYKRILYW